MYFFLDKHISIRIAQFLSTIYRNQPHHIAHIQDRYGNGITDIEWMSRLSSEGNWIIISADLNILRNPQERAAWLEAGLTTIFLPEGFTSLGKVRQSCKTICWWPDIINFSQKNPSGIAVYLNLSGKFQVLNPLEVSRRRFITQSQPSS